MNYNEIKEIITHIQETGISKFKYESDGVKITVEQQIYSPSVVPAATPPVPLTVSVAPPVEVPPSPEESATRHFIKAPLVGTFYRQSSPEASSFVEVGDRVKKGDILCIIEAMKLMNEITSDITGIVASVFVDNASAVEFDTKLFEIKKD